MPGDVGLVAQTINTIFSWFTSEGGYEEMVRERAIRAKKVEAHRALQNNDFPALRQSISELERLSSQP